MKMLNEWEDKHYKVITSFLKFLNEKSDDFILKGDTALLTCYNLDRFSEDIDLDARNNRNLEKLVEDFCNKYQYKYNVKKDTNTTKRFFIGYSDNSKLKIEVSYRRNKIEENELTKINGILVYNINELGVMKTSAYMGRNKIRDLYDLCFIVNNYWDKLSEDVKSVIRVAVEYKGIEQFEFLSKDNLDELVNMQKLEDDFLKTFDKLGLLLEESENQEISEENKEDEDEEE